MRLIDADAFEKFIEGKYKDGESTDDIKDQMLFDLSYQPTAYNVDAVVEEIKKLEKPYSAEEWFADVKLRKAIKIVRKGGVNENNN